MKNKQKDGVKQVGGGCIHEESKGKSNSFIYLGGLMF